ncbi:hypothetical protein ERJ75_000025800 [Trypanosoma vivax]|nr:hypothetical protein ERJ75_000025800 [Trypanosoma vivax]
MGRIQRLLLDNSHALRSLFGIGDDGVSYVLPGHAALHTAKYGTHVLLASQPLTVDELADLVNKTLSLQLCSAKMVGVHGTLKRLSNALMSEECCGSVPNPDRDVSKKRGISCAIAARG